ncbi:MAG: FtsX-like permease family protein [Gammaproteobacteria bacterium]|nr:FtsX-like permease family protein [Gammaproteobacteria bacterium]
MKRAVFRPLAVLLSWRYVRTKDVALLFVTKTSALGLIISITVLLVVQGIVAGFQQDLDRNVLGFIPHLTLTKPTGVDDELAVRVQAQIPEVESAALVIQQSGLLSTASVVRRAQFIGIQPEAHSEFLQSTSTAAQTSWTALEQGNFKILLGRGLAAELDVEQGDQVLVTVAKDGMSPFGFAPRQKRFTVAGLVATYSQLDSMVAYIHQDDGRRLLQLPATANAAFFKLRDPLAVSSVFYAVYRAANDTNLLASSWIDIFGSLFNFLIRFKNLLFLLLSLLVAVAAFNLVSSMVMLVQSRRADVAVLRTIGGDGKMVLLSFLATAWMIALASFCLCVLLAWLISLALPTLHGLLVQLIGVSLEEGFPLHRLRVVLHTTDVAKVIGVTLLMVTVGSLYPAWRATRLPPAEILRNE